MNKQLGRPKGSGKYPVRKHIYISEEMNKNWDPSKIRNFLSNGNGKAKINKKDSKEVIISNLVSMIKREKDNIPMELVRSFELYFRTIKER